MPTIVSSGPRGQGVATTTNTAANTEVAAAGTSPGLPAGMPGNPAALFETGASTTSAAISARPPEVLLQLQTTAVTHGTDPGDFYCEHTFFVAQQTAAILDSVRKNSSGEALVGFLHCPGDQYTLSRADVPQQNDRHTNTRHVVGAALRGYIATITPTLVGDEPAKILLSGYGRFNSVVNNPTGDFVQNQENLDAAMQIAFGRHLLTERGTVDGEGPTIRYRIRDPASATERDVLVHAAFLDVADAAISPEFPWSIPSRMLTFKPHAVLSMGVSTRATKYLAEFHADDAGLEYSGTRASHTGSVFVNENMPDNYSLARAIHLGGVAISSSTTADSPLVAGFNPLSVRTQPPRTGKDS